MDGKFGEEGKSSLLIRAIKYFFLGLALLISVTSLANSVNPFGTLLFLAILWTAGFFLYRSRKGLGRWSQSEVPLKDYILTKRDEEERKAIDSRENSIDSKNLISLTDNEHTKWSGIVDSFYDDDTTFDVIKPPKKRRKKDK